MNVPAVFLRQLEDLSPWKKYSNDTNAPKTFRPKWDFGQGGRDEGRDRTEKCHDPTEP